MKNYRPTIVGFAILVVLMTAGAAQSLSGSNTVFSDDIVDRAVANADLGTNSITRAKIADNAIAGPEVVNNSISGADVLGASLTYEAEGDSAELAAGESADFDAFCSGTADEALSGQWEAWNNATDEPTEQIAVSVNASTGDGWTFHIKNTSGDSAEVSTWAICMQN